MIPLSVLDLSPIPEGSDAGTALRRSLSLAQHAEALGFRRFWMAEHHNMPGIASAATAVALAHVAAGTSTIRIGSGGIMLPNHAPLAIAEQFGTLASLHPGRIDLGLGRAPGSDGRTAAALRRDPASADRFPQDVLELQHYFRSPEPGQAVQAVPGAGLTVPIWLLGSSLFSAQLAAMLGLPFAFASHFAPDAMMAALDIYRSRFEPSEALDRPYAMVGVNAVAADTDAEANRLSTSFMQSFVALRRGVPGKLRPPVDSMDGLWTPLEEAQVRQALSVAVIGAPDRVREGLRALAARTGADELIVTANIFDHEARLRSFTLVAEAGRDASGTAGVLAAE
ncbi:LLM class flavin-dependent oxidoreductase [Rhizosaccharibacter radicis]|uniref:LLM class flavin-dependent oxidoreductase n=1 Tax=Rhizosaccharibacter radicis TaxID=2782605 RepID=A0ABT1VZ04_9PROT|nr:LLM class flavin-dependent oxidoreductase [Acetobacteraceae bacterium KSS12]